MARQKSEFVSAAGTVFEIVKGLSDEVRTLGGSDDSLRRLLAEQPLRRQVAELLVGSPVRTALSDPYQVRVDHFGRSLAQVIEAGHYDGYVNPNYQKMEGWSVWTQRDGSPVERALHEQTEELRLFHLGAHFGEDYYPTSDEVIKALAGLGMMPTVCRLPFFGEQHPEVQRQFPIIELGSLRVHPNGRRRVASLWSNSDKRDLSLIWDDPDNQWHPRCRVLAASK